MTTLRERQVSEVAQPTPTAAIWEWVLGVIGGLAIFIGLVMQIGEPDGTLSVFGWSWTYGTVAEAWKFGLMAVGSLFLSGAFAISTWRVYIREGMMPKAIVTTVLSVAALLAAIAVVLIWLI